jgi:hypothetical protein
MVQVFPGYKASLYAGHFTVVSFTGKFVLHVARFQMDE